MNDRRPTPEELLEDSIERFSTNPPGLPVFVDDLTPAEMSEQFFERLAEHGYVIVEAERLDWLERIEEAAEQMPIDLDDWITDD